MYRLQVQEYPCSMYRIFVPTSVEIPDVPVGDPPVKKCHVTFKISLMLYANLHSTSTDILLSHLFVKPAQFLLLFALSYNEYDIGRVFLDNVELDVSVKMLVKTIDL